MVDELKVVPPIRCCLCEKDYKPEDRSNIPDVCHNCAVADLRAAVLIVKRLRKEVDMWRKQANQDNAGGF